MSNKQNLSYSLLSYPRNGYILFEPSFIGQGHVKVRVTQWQGQVKAKSQKYILVMSF